MEEPRLVIHLRNFRRWTKRTFEFGDQTLYLIKGDNGAGKTTIFEAVVWCLYGRLPPIPGLRKFVDVAPKSRPEAKTRVTLQIRLKERTVHVTRRRGPGHLVVNTGHRELTQTAAQDWIHQHFGSLERWMIGTFLAQESNNPFLFGTDAERLDYLSNLCFIDTTQPQAHLEKINAEFIRLKDLREAKDVKRKQARLSRQEFLRNLASRNKGGTSSGDQRGNTDQRGSADQRGNTDQRRNEENTLVKVREGWDGYLEDLSQGAQAREQLEQELRLAEQRAQRRKELSILRDYLSQDLTREQIEADSLEQSLAKQRRALEQVPEPSWSTRQDSPIDIPTTLERIRRRDKLRESLPGTSEEDLTKVNRLLKDSVHSGGPAQSTVDPVQRPSTWTTAVEQLLRTYKIQQDQYQKYQDQSKELGLQNPDSEVLAREIATEELRRQEYDVREAELASITAILVTLEEQLTTVQSELIHLGEPLLLKEQAFLQKQQRSLGKRRAELHQKQRRLRDNSLTPTEPPGKFRSPVREILPPLDSQPEYLELTIALTQVRVDLAEVQHHLDHPTWTCPQCQATLEQEQGQLRVVTGLPSLTATHERQTILLQKQRTLQEQRSLMKRDYEKEVQDRDREYNQRVDGLRKEHYAREDQHRHYCQWQTELARTTTELTQTEEEWTTLLVQVAEQDVKVKEVEKQQESLHDRQRQLTAMRDSYRNQQSLMSKYPSFSQERLTKLKGLVICVPPPLSTTVIRRALKAHQIHESLQEYHDLEGLTLSKVEQLRELRTKRAKLQEQLRNLEANLTKAQTRLQEYHSRDQELVQELTQCSEGRTVLEIMRELATLKRNITLSKKRQEYLRRDAKYQGIKEKVITLERELQVMIDLKEVAIQTEYNALYSTVQNMNLEINEVLAHLFPEPTFLEIRLEREHHKRGQDLLVCALDLIVHQEGAEYQIRELGGGAKKMLALSVCISQAIHSEFPCMFLDEPQTFFSQESRKSSLEIIKKTVEEQLQHKCTIVVSHELQEGIYDSVIELRRRS